jgi:hypothetical protein
VSGIGEGVDDSSDVKASRLNNADHLFVFVRSQGGPLYNLQPFTLPERGAAGRDVIPKCFAA